MLNVVGLYEHFSIVTDPESIEHPYLSEDTNYMLAFAKWGEDLTIDDIQKDFPEITQKQLEQLKKDISDFVDMYMLNWARCKPIQDIR